MSFKGNGSSGLTRTTDPPWSNSQRGVSIGAWVKYDGSGTTGVGTIAATFNKAGTVGAANRLFKNAAAYGSISNSESTAPATTGTISSSVKAGGWQFLANQFLTTTLRKGFVSGIGSNHGLDQIRVTTSLGSHSDQTGVCVGHLDIITPTEYLQSSFIVANVMFFGSVLDPSEIWALANGGHPLDSRVCRRPAQFYPLLDNGFCEITGLKLSDVGAPAWSSDMPALRRPNRLRLMPLMGAPASSGVTGNLAATESGADTASMDGDVIVQGSLAATESGSDTHTSTGTVLVKGALAGTEAGADTFVGIGGGISSGTMAATESGADVAAFAGGVIVSGNVSATESSSDTLVSTGTVGVRGALIATESGADAFASTGTVVGGTIAGSLAATETGSDIFEASSAVARSIVAFTIVADGGTRIAALDGMKIQ